MAREWIVPTYVYRHEDLQTQFKRLIKMFLDANNDDIVGFAKSITGLAPGHVRSMLARGLDSTRLSMFGDKIKTVTGIDLDRMMVTDAKLAIMKGLENLDALRKQDPKLAFLLEVNPDLKDNIDFSALTTREEIVLEVQLVCDEVGSPMLSQQMLLGVSAVVKWWDAKVPHLPSGDNLKRAIILLATGPIIQDPSVPSRDDVRFRLVSQMVLGMSSQDALGVRNFPEALVALNLGTDQDMLSTVANRTGLTAGLVKSLRSWSAAKSSGKMPASSMGKIIRHLLARAHLGSVAAFDKALATFLKKGSNGWANTPVFWPRAAKTEKRTEAPDPKLVKDQDTNPNLTPMARSLEPEVPDAPEADQAALTLPELIQFEQAMVALKMLLAKHPSLKDKLPEDLTRVVVKEVPVEVQEEGPPENGTGPPATQPQTGPQWFMALVERKARPDAAELAQIGVIVRAIPQLVRKLLPLPKPQRKRFLRGVDGAMLETAELLQAADATEPQKFLEFLEPADLAQRIAGQGAGNG